MPKLKENQVPSYRLHKQSGQAIVTLNGRDFLLPNLCQFCGYDLRATPERCPECGMLRGKGPERMGS